jgi:hypothetical protein
MSREFYTEKDIEDMVKRGILSLELNDRIVLTELAYEKARSKGMKLVHDGPDTPPAAPIRPYISKMPAAPSASSGSAFVSVPSQGCSEACKDEESGLQQHIRDAVAARLGAQVDANLLDVIIKRVLKSTGLK